MASPVNLPPPELSGTGQIGAGVQTGGTNQIGTVSGPLQADEAILQELEQAMLAAFDELEATYQGSAEIVHANVTTGAQKGAEPAAEKTTWVAGNTPSNLRPLMMGLKPRSFSKVSAQNTENVQSTAPAEKNERNGSIQDHGRPLAKEIFNPAQKVRAVMNFIKSLKGASLRGSKGTAPSYSPMMEGKREELNTKREELRRQKELIDNGLIPKDEMDAANEKLCDLTDEVEALEREYVQLGGGDTEKVEEFVPTATTQSVASGPTVHPRPDLSKMDEILSSGDKFTEAWNAASMNDRAVLANALDGHPLSAASLQIASDRKYDQVDAQVKDFITQTHNYGSSG